MPGELERYQAAQRKLAEVETQIHRMKGQQELLMSQLRELGYNDVEGAEADLVNLQNELASCVTEIQSVLSQFETGLRGLGL